MRWLTILWLIRKHLKNLTLGHIEHKMDNEITNQTSLCKWMAEQEVGRMVKRQTIKDRNLSRDTIAHNLKGHGTLEEEKR